MDNSVSIRADMNLIAAIKSRAEVVDGGGVLEFPGYVMYTIGMESEDGHLNGMVCLDDGKAQEALEASAEYFKKLGCGYSVWIRGNENPKLEKLLKDKGYSPRREPGSAVMVITNRLEGIELKEGYNAQKVETEEDRKDLAKVIAECFEKDIHLAEHMFSQKITASSENVSAYLIYDGKKPVASAVTVASGDTAGIYWVGVVAEKRREGLGAYIVKLSTNEGFDKGAKEVILQASEVGEFLYNKLGYETLKRYRSYPISATK